MQLIALIIGGFQAELPSSDSDRSFRGLAFALAAIFSLGAATVLDFLAGWKMGGESWIIASNSSSEDSGSLFPFNACYKISK